MSGSRVVRVAVPDLISNSYFPAIAAVEMGFFKEQGLQASLELIAPVERAYLALRDGRVDFVGGSAHSALSAFPNWKGVKLLCAQAQGMYWFLVMRSDLGIKRGELTGLKNMRIGAAPWVGIPFKYLLEQAGVSIVDEKIEVKPVPSTVDANVNFGVAAAEALEAGTIDGFWANGMGAEVALRRGVGSLVLDVRRGDGPKGCYDYTMSSIATSDSFLNERPDAVAATVRAVMRAQKALKENPESAFPIAQRLFPETEAGLIVDILRRDLPYYDPRVSRHSVEAMNAFARDAGILTADVGYFDVVAEQAVSLWEL